MWGHYIDELIQLRLDPAGSPQDRYVLSDTLYRAMCLVAVGGEFAVNRMVFACAHC